jgi:hypothetical protein
MQLYTIVLSDFKVFLPEGELLLLKDVVERT